MSNCVFGGFAIKSCFVFKRGQKSGQLYFRLTRSTHTYSDFVNNYMRWWFWLKIEKKKSEGKPVEKVATGLKVLFQTFPERATRQKTSNENRQRSMMIAFWGKTIMDVGEQQATSQETLAQWPSVCHFPLSTIAPPARRIRPIWPLTFAHTKLFRYYTAFVS